MLKFSGGVAAISAVGIFLSFSDVEWVKSLWPFFITLAVLANYNLFFYYSLRMVAKREDALMESFTTLKNQFDEAEKESVERYRNLKNLIKIELLLEGRLIKDSKGVVHKIENGRRRWVINEAVFDKHGYNWKDVWPLPDDMVHSIPPGEDIT